MEPDKTELKFRAYPIPREGLKTTSRIGLLNCPTCSVPIQILESQWKHSRPIFCGNCGDAFSIIDGRVVRPR